MVNRLHTAKGTNLAIGAWILIALLILPFCGCGDGEGGGSPPSSPGLGSAPPGSAFTLVWSDEFDGGAGTKVDAQNWLYDIGTGYPGGPSNWGTGEIEYMTDDLANVYQDGMGHLVIKPIRGGGTFDWTSGRIET